jgi:hypothetical protein
MLSGFTCQWSSYLILINNLHNLEKTHIENRFLPAPEELGILHAEDPACALDGTKYFGVTTGNLPKI